MKIAVLNQKGGVGKTTLAVNIAAELGRGGDRVLLLDTDSQGSSSDWDAARAVANNVFVVSKTANDAVDLHLKLDSLAEGFDHTVIDGPPSVSTITKGAILSSDIVLVPVRPGPLDLWASVEMIEKVLDGMHFRPKLKAFFVVNCFQKQSGVSGEMRSALASAPFPVANTSITQRTIFPKSLARGLAVCEVKEGAEAAQEIADLVKEIRGSVE